MKQRKPRTKEQNQFYEGKHCWYDDGSKWKECNRPWADKCDGNQHKCKHLKMKYLASLSEDKRKKYLEIYG